jgi:hypothetical protein
VSKFAGMKFDLHELHEDLMLLTVPLSLIGLEILALTGLSAFLPIDPFAFQQIGLLIASRWFGS